MKSDIIWLILDRYFLYQYQVATALLFTLQVKWSCEPVCHAHLFANAEKCLRDTFTIDLHLSAYNSAAALLLDLKG